MSRIALVGFVLLAMTFPAAASAQVSQRVVDIPTRQGVTQRFVLLTPKQPKAAVISLMDKLARVPRKELMAFKGGQSRGDPCEAFAYHGFNGLESDVVRTVAGWIVSM